MFRPTNVTLNCPHCGFSYQAPVFSIIDVGQTPDLKQLVLSGQLNASRCPNCQNINYLATPLLYHDPEHEFLGIFMPTQLNMTEDQRQKAIGDLTRALMDALPAEQRRGYMLTPQEFLTMDSLIEKLLGFEGITPEMIEASNRKVQLVNDLLQVVEDDDAFTAMVEGNQELLDQEFFMLLSNFVLSAESQGLSEQVEQLSQMREKLLPLTDVGKRIQKQREAVLALGENPSRTEIMQALIDGDMDEVEAISVAAQPMLDYQFFQDFTTRIEAAPEEEQPQLEAKRERMLEIVEQLRRNEAEQMQAASGVIQELLAAEDMEAAVRENLPNIDQTVLALLASNIAQAEQQGATAAVNRLSGLYDAIMAALQERMPPELSLLFKLAEANYPDETRVILQENQELLSDDFFAMLEANIQQMEASEGEDTGQEGATRHLRNVLTQARLGV